MCYSLKVWKRAYCVLYNNICNGGEIEGWVLKKYLFHTHPCFSTWWSGMMSSLSFLRMSLKMSNAFYYKVSPRKDIDTIHPPTWDVVTSHWDQVHEKLLNTCLSFKKIPHIDFLELHGKGAQRSKWQMQEYVVFWLDGIYIIKWFGIYTTHWLHDTLIDSFMNKALL